MVVRLANVPTIDMHRDANPQPRRLRAHCAVDFPLT